MGTVPPYLPHFLHVDEESWTGIRDSGGKPHSDGMSTRQQLVKYLSAREAKGCTFRDVPIIMRSSHSSVS